MATNALGKLDEAHAWIAWAPLVAAGVVGFAVRRWGGAGLLVTAGASVGAYVVTRQVVEAKVRQEVARSVEGELGSFFARARESVVGG